MANTQVDRIVHWDSAAGNPSLEGINVRCIQILVEGTPVGDLEIRDSSETTPFIGPMLPAIGAAIIIPFGSNGRFFNELYLESIPTNTVVTIYLG